MTAEWCHGTSSSARRAWACSHWSSENTETPCFRRAAAVTPCPGMSDPEKVPSWMRALPHEGLLSLSTATRIPIRWQSDTVARAPAMNVPVTSSPVRPKALAWASRTASPPPPVSSTGGRGVPRPAAISGQKGRIRFSRSHRSSTGCLEIAAVPSYRTGSPTRQELTRTLCMEPNVSEVRASEAPFSDSIVSEILTELTWGGGRMALGRPA